MVRGGDNLGKGGMRLLDPALGVSWVTGRDCEREGGGGSEKGVDGFEVDGERVGDVFDEFMVAEVRRVA